MRQRAASAAAGVGDAASGAPSRRPGLLVAKLGVVAAVFERACIDAGLVGRGGFGEGMDAEEEEDDGEAAEEGKGGYGAGRYLAASHDAPTHAGGSQSAAGPSPPPPSAALYRFIPPVHAVAAASGDGVPALRASLLRLALPRPWLYGSSMKSDLSPTERLSEVIRERLFRYLHREVPYTIRQETRSWRETPEGELVIDQDLQVPSQHVARMLTARRGGPIRAITQEAVAELRDAWGKKVHLFLHIAVKDKRQLQTALVRDAAREG
jgi:hypothetical protein